VGASNRICKPKRGGSWVRIDANPLSINHGGEKRQARVVRVLKGQEGRNITPSTKKKTGGYWNGDR